MMWVILQIVLRLLLISNSSGFELAKTWFRISVLRVCFTSFWSTHHFRKKNIVGMSFQTNRNPTIRITLLSSTLLSVRQQFQNGLSHTSCFSSLCVHRCRPLSHSTMRSKSFWNCLYIFLRLVCMFFFYGFDPTHKIKKKILWKCLSDFKKILHLCVATKLAFPQHERDEVNHFVMICCWIDSVQCHKKGSKEIFLTTKIQILRRYMWTLICINGVCNLRPICNMVQTRIYFFRTDLDCKM